VSKKGLKIPKTYVYGKKEGLKKFPTRWITRVLKPVDSFTVNLGRKNITFADNKSLSEFMQKRSDLIDNVIIQQIVPGGDSNTYQATTYVSEAGCIPQIFTMRKIRQYEPDFGITSYGVSETIPEVKEIVLNFLNSIQYRGFASIEFKRHPTTGIGTLLN
jgi:predicted ATP-grasp superfamily ATP-dependent carboligase